MDDFDAAETSTENLTYSEAAEELEALLAELETATVSVDALVEKVARGVALIRLCRSHLQQVDTKVETLLTEIEALNLDTHSDTDADEPNVEVG